MANLKLWELLAQMKSAQYKWVDLTQELSPETPHWYGFEPMGIKNLFDFDAAPMRVNEYRLPGQYGTHVDVPLHFDAAGRAQHEINVEEFAYPLCVVDKSAACATDSDYALTIEDILAWEAENGKIPEGAFVAFRSDWYMRGKDLDNRDAEGNAHYPGWDLACVKWLCEERKIGSIGHETADTDPACRQAEIGFAAEDYILRQDKIQLELLCNLDQCPPTGAIIFCTFPKLRGGTGFSARCFAICPA